MLVTGIAFVVLTVHVTGETPLHCATVIVEELIPDEHPLLPDAGLLQPCFDGFVH